MHRYGSPDMGGFTLSFMIPFERTSVFDELLVADNPLGSAPNVAFTVLAPGYYEAEVSASVSRSKLSRAFALDASLCRSRLAFVPRALSVTPCWLHLFVWRRCHPDAFARCSLRRPSLARQYRS